MILPNLPAVVHLEMLACLLMSPSITSELLFPLSSQGGYTMAYCQKEIKWWKAHTQVVLYFEGIAVPTADLQLPVLCAHVATLVETSRGWAGCATGFPWAALGSEDQEEDRFGILRCLSCDQVGKRCRNAGTQNNRLFLLINWTQAGVSLGAFGKRQRHTTLLWSRRFLEWQPLFLRERRVPPNKAQVAEEITCPEGHSLHSLYWSWCESLHSLQNGTHFKHFLQSSRNRTCFQLF